MRRPVVLALVIAALAVPLAGCGGDDEETGAEETTSTTTATTGGEEGDATAGKEVFATAGCGGCHTFAAAGSNGTTGPNLDDLGPSFDAVVEQVTNGGGAMPAFKDELTEQQIRDVAAFVSGS